MIPAKSKASCGLMLPSFPPRIADRLVLITVERGQKGNFLALYLQGKPGPTASMAQGHTCHVDGGGGWECFANTLKLCFEVAEMANR